MNEAGRMPRDAHLLALEITQVSSERPPLWDYQCIGHLSYDEPVTTLVGTDSDGSSWTLAFSGPGLPTTRFPLGTALEIESLHLYSTQFEPTRALTVRQEGQVIAHFETGPHEASPPSDLELVVEEGLLACPWSLPDPNGCSITSFHTRARLGDESVDDPCQTQLGPFVVSSSFRGGRYLRECDGRIGGCDAADDFLVSIIRDE